MPIWLENSRSPTLKLVELPTSEQWLRVVSTLCRSTSLGQLTLVEAGQIVEKACPGFEPSNAAISLPLALEALEGLSANMVAKIAHLYIKEIREGRISGDAATTKQKILDRFEVSEDELYNLCYGRGFQFDPVFVDSVFNRTVAAEKLNKQERRNRDRLLNYRLLRRLLAYRYLTKI